MEDSSLCCARPGDAVPLYSEILSEEASASRHALTFAPLACHRSTQTTTVQQPDFGIRRSLVLNDAGLIGLRVNAFATTPSKIKGGCAAVERGHGSSAQQLKTRD